MRHCKRSCDSGLLEKDQAVPGPHDPGIRNPVRQTEAGTEITAFQVTSRVREVQHLRSEIEDCTLITNFGRWEIQRVSGPGVQRETRREFPIISQKKLCNMSAFLNDMILDVDREGIHLPQQKGSEGITAIGDGRVVCACCRE